MFVGGRLLVLLGKLGKEVDPDLLPCVPDSAITSLACDCLFAACAQHSTTALLELEQWKWTAWLILVFLCLLQVSLRRESNMVVISSVLEVGFVCAVQEVQNVCLGYV